MSAAAEELSEVKNVLVRRFEAGFAVGDGRTIDMRIVPFAERATVADGHGGVPKGVPYEEEWMPGAFDKQTSAAHRILLNFEHGTGLANVIGRGIDLRQPADGYHASFRVLEGADGDKALQLVKDGVLTGASVEAIPLKSIRSKGGVVQRVKAHLDAVALCRMGAFPSAVVTAVREGEAMFVDEDLLPVPLDDAIVERCRRLGVKLPDRLAAVMVRAYSEAAWDGNASRWPTAAAYCSACAIDMNPSGKPKTKTLCHLPYKEPGSGDVNVDGVRAALGRIGQGFPKDASQSQRDDAKAMFERILSTANKGGGSTQRAATPMDGDQKASNRIAMMIATANNFIADEDDPEDKATMQGIISQLQRLRAKEGTEPA